MRELIIWSAVIATGCQCGSARLVTREESLDGGSRAAGDASVVDAGVVDAGVVDAGVVDAGVVDAGVVDAGVVDAGLRDSGIADAGATDGGVGCVEGDRRCAAGGAELCRQGVFVADPSAVGCDFWAGILGYQVLGYVGGNTFAVTVSNPGSRVAVVTVEGGMLTAPRQVAIAPGSVAVEPLSDQNPTKAFHLTSTEPVSAVQFNPLHAISGGTHTYSCDSSLLRPVAHWGRTHVIASWPAQAPVPGLLGLTTRVRTVVTVTPRVSIASTPLSPALPANTATSFALDAGVFLELQAQTGDLTGSLVEADQPLEVFAGHYGTNIPTALDAADRLEELMPPTARLSTEAFVVAPALPSIPGGKVQTVRIIAAEPDVDLSFEPAQSVTTTHLTAAGDFVQLAPSAAAYRVTATKKVLVAQYMHGQEAGGGMGDPAMLVPLPREQWTRRVVFHAPPDYSANAVDVVAPTNTTVTLDGAPLAGWAPIGTTGFSLARVSALGAGPNADGTHVVNASAPVFVLLSGFGDYTSYWHPG